jgi:Pyruvate/2-oxoacid:ferredoxin oxidoreductase delta subunit
MMKTRVLRKIVKIDEEKCNGCGACIISCAEGALQIIDGKARLVSEKYCDGLGACLGKCPQDAISVVDAQAAEFDEAATRLHLQKKESTAPADENLPCGCSSAAVQHFKPEDCTEAGHNVHEPSRLGHWPVQLTLVPPHAPFLQGADVLLAADCVPCAYAGFHRDFLRDRALLLACPKLDDFPTHLKKLTDILNSSDVKTITVVHMEVPCCSGLVHMATRAIRESGKDIPLQEITISAQGEIKA